MYDEIKLRIEQLKQVLEEKDGSKPYSFDSNCPVKGINKIIYGTPGCGKSFYLENEILSKQLNIPHDNSHRVRTIFFSDYTNSDFIGQIYPSIRSDKTVTYEFKPGPFTIALENAIVNIDQPVALIIEEINRGDAASIFGEIFQLLDRDQYGKSRYTITNPVIQEYLTKKYESIGLLFDCISIPRNLFIFATMNTSDQGVYSLDTAFKRRWLFEKLPNEFTSAHSYQNKLVPGIINAKYSWKEFVTAINYCIREITDIPNAEDKQLGVYFVEEDLLITDASEDSEAKRLDFAYKVLEYLWDDVSKIDHATIFNPSIHSVDEIITIYKQGGTVFNEIVLKKLDTVKQSEE